MSAATAEVNAGTLLLAGELNIYRAAELRQLLLAALNRGEQTLQVDLAGVTEVDSAGVQLLAAARRSAQDAGTALQFIHPSAAVGEVLALLGATDALLAP